MHTGLFATYAAVALVGGSVTLGACAPIQQQTNIVTPVNQSATAGVGDVIFRAEGRESMPNVFGRADIFGRTRSTGVVLVQYGGIHDGRVVLLRSGITTQSDATTMNSTGMLVPTQQNTSVSGMVGATPVAGVSTTTGLTYIPPVGSTTTTMQQPTIPVEIDWRKNPRVPIAGQTLVIERADDRSVAYHLE
jgi:hypothetical protein